jgi:hypothetical protein
MSEWKRSRNAGPEKSTNNENVCRRRQAIDLIMLSPFGHRLWEFRPPYLYHSPFGGMLLVSRRLVRISPSWLRSRPLFCCMSACLLLDLDVHVYPYARSTGPYVSSPPLLNLHNLLKGHHSSWETSSTGAFRVFFSPSSVRNDTRCFMASHSSPLYDRQLLDCLPE